MSWLRKAVSSFLVPTLVLGTIEVVARVGDVSPVILPRPSAIVLVASELWLTVDFLQDVAATLLRLIQGFGISLAVAIPIGLVVGASDLGNRLSATTVDFLRSLPATALIPAFIIAFGVGETNKLAMVAFVVSLIMIVQVREGIRGIPRAPLEVARIFGLGKTVRLLVVGRLALPAFLAGVQVSVNLALVMVVVVEMFVGGGSRTGIGRRIYEAQATLQIGEMWAGILAVGMVGYLLAVLTRGVSRKLAPWAVDRREDKI